MTLGRWVWRHFWRDAPVRFKFPQSFWENVFLTDDTKVELFRKGINTVFIESAMRPSKKRTCPYSHIWWRFHEVLGSLCCLWHWTPWLCGWHHEICRLPKKFGSQCRASDICVWHPSLLHKHKEKGEISSNLASIKLWLASGMSVLQFYWLSEPQLHNL